MRMELFILCLKWSNSSRNDLPSPLSKLLRMMSEALKKYVSKGKKKKGGSTLFFFTLEGSLRINKKLIFPVSRTNVSTGEADL